MERLQNEGKAKEGMGKIRNAIGAGVLAVASAVAPMSSGVEAKTTVVGVNRASNPELLEGMTLDASAQEFFDENNLSLQVVKNPTNGPGRTAVCIMISGMALIDVCFLEDTKSAILSYDRKKRVLYASIVNKNGSKEETKYLPKFDDIGRVVDFFD